MFNMKRLLLILILMLSFQTLSKADDIRDFEIEGISIGDSLLDFVSKEYIDNQKPFIYPKSTKFKEYRVDIQLLQYDMITVTVKASDNQYIIYSMMADLSFRNNFNKCKTKKNQILKEIKNVIGEFEKEEDDRYERSLDKSGNSYDESTTIYFKNGDNIRVICTNWSETMDNGDRLTIAINTEEFFNWLLNKAY
jgi:hypothetical protein